MIRQRIIACIYIWLQAYAIWSFKDIVLLPVLMAVAAAVAVPLRLRLPLVGWGWVVLLVAAGGGTIAGWLLGPEELADGSVTWPMFAASFLVFVQLGEMYRVQPTGSLPKYMVGLGIAGIFCVFNGATGVARPDLLLFAASAVVTSAALLCDATGDRHVADRGGVAVRRQILLGTVLLTAAWGAWQFSDHCTYAVREVRGWLAGRLALAAPQRRFMRGYPTVATLRTINKEKKTNAMDIAVRIRSRSLPGYLRGRVYSRYDGAQWHVSSGGSKRRRRAIRPLERWLPGLPASRTDGNIFELRPKSPGLTQRIEIQNDPLRGDVYFLPLETTHIQASASMLSVDRNRVIYSGIRTRRPYFAYLDPDAEFGALDYRQQRMFTEPPRGVVAEVRDWAARVGRGKTRFSERVRAVESFFRNNFEYSMEDVVIPRGADPLSHFIVNRTAAHCEFFASGAVTLLRYQGIPARYVTGYVAAEKDESGEFWIARNRDAHAWAEAYDAQRRKWVIVEATPGMDVLLEDDESADADELADADDQIGSEGFVASWLDWALIYETLGALGDSLKTPWGLALVAAVLFLLLKIGYRRTRRPRPADSRLAQYETMHHRWNRRLKRRKLIRQPSETLHQFAARIRAAADRDAPAWLLPAADWFVQYALLLYGGKPDFTILDQTKQPAS